MSFSKWPVQSLSRNKSGRRLTRRQVTALLGTSRVNETALANMQGLDLLEADLARAFAYGPRTDAVIILNLKCAASTLLKRLELSEAEISCNPHLIDEIRVSPSSRLWDDQQRLSQPLRFSGTEWDTAWHASTWVATCRNPYSRFVSAFEHMHKLRILNRSITLKDFAKWCSKGDNVLKNRHWMPQSVILNSKVLERLNFLAPVEQLSSVASGPLWLAKDLNAVDHRSLSNDDSRERITPEIQSLILNTYHLDFVRFGYSTEILDLREAPCF